MKQVVFYFQVHQPFRLRRYSLFDIGVHQRYFDDAENARIVRRIAERCYLPMNNLVRQLIERHAGDFRCSYSISGAALEQFEQWTPEVLESFEELASTGCVEFLCETSMHSLSGLFDEQEFVEQVEAQRQRIQRLCGVQPLTFRNTELVIEERLAQLVEELGFRVLLGEGADHLLERPGSSPRSAHQVYRPQGTRELRLLLRDYPRSDDIAFRFSNRTWHEYPLTADRFARWVAEDQQAGECVGLFMDYETFGEHQWADTGIFQFMEHLPTELLRHRGLSFATPAQFQDAPLSGGELAIPRATSWADAERDISAWQGNPMQKAASEAFWALGERVREVPELLSQWRRLSTSDHFYYMCTKHFSDGDVHKYFSPYASPHEAFLCFMNVLDDLARRADQAKNHPPRMHPSTRKDL